MFLFFVFFSFSHSKQICFCSDETEKNCPTDFEKIKLESEGENQILNQKIENEPQIFDLFVATDEKRFPSIYFQDETSPIDLLNITSFSSNSKLIFNFTNEIKQCFVEYTNIESSDSISMTIDTLNISNSSIKGSFIIQNLQSFNSKGSAKIAVNSSVLLNDSDYLIESLIDCTNCTEYEISLGNQYSDLIISNDSISLKHNITEEYIHINAFKTLTIQASPDQTMLIFQPASTELSSFDYNLQFIFTNSSSTLIIDYKWEMVQLANENQNKISFTTQEKLYVNSDYDELPISDGYISFDVETGGEIIPQTKQKGFLCLYSKEYNTPEQCRNTLYKPVLYSKNSDNPYTVDLQSYSDILNIIVLNSNEDKEANYPIIKTNSTLKSLSLSKESIMAIHNTESSLTGEELSINNSKLYIIDKEIIAKTVSLTDQSFVTTDKLTCSDLIQLDDTSFIINKDYVDKLISEKKVKIEIDSFSYITFSSNSFKLNNADYSESTDLVTLIIKEKFIVSVMLE